jgi:hypothetical protein
MEPLRAFVSHEQVVSHASSSFHETDCSMMVKNMNGFDQTSKLAVTSESRVQTPMNPSSSLGCHDTGSSEPESKQETKIFLRTKYSIQVELDKDAVHVLNISFCPEGSRSTSAGQEDGRNSSSAIQEPQPNEPDANPPKIKSSEEKHRYRLFPDWQTTYLWYDPSWPGNPDDPVVELDEIEKKYSTLFPFYLSWLKSHDSELDKLFSGSDGDEDPQSDLSHLLAWEINGFLMSCWFAFQTDVHSVEFKPSDISYEITRDTMESEFQRYLERKSHELQRVDLAERP